MGLVKKKEEYEGEGSRQDSQNGLMSRTIRLNVRN